MTKPHPDTERIDALERWLKTYPDRRKRLLGGIEFSVKHGASIRAAIAEAFAAFPLPVADLDDPICKFGLPYSAHTHPHECYFPSLHSPHPTASTGGAE